MDPRARSSLHGCGPKPSSGAWYAWWSTDDGSRAGDSSFRTDGRGATSGTVTFVGLVVDDQLPAATETPPARAD
ncbi:MAG: hypothetical protein GY772_30720 [bacterium]|nr:hypothetical protein [bacterium]